MRFAEAGGRPARTTGAHPRRPAHFTASFSVMSTGSSSPKSSSARREGMVVGKGVLDQVRPRARRSRKKRCGLPMPATACTGACREGGQRPRRSRGRDAARPRCASRSMRSSAPRAASSLQRGMHRLARSPRADRAGEAAPRARAAGRPAAAGRCRSRARHRARRSAQSRARRRCCSPSSQRMTLGAAADQPLRAAHAVRVHDRGAAAAAAQQQRLIAHLAPVRVGAHRARLARCGGRSRARRCPPRRRWRAAARPATG